MSKIITIITVFVAITSTVHAETYDQCKKRVKNDIAAYEKQTGKKVSSENKRLAVQAYCSGK